MTTAQNSQMAQNPCSVSCRNMQGQRALERSVRRRAKESKESAEHVAAKDQPEDSSFSLPFNWLPACHGSTCFGRLRK